MKSSVYAVAIGLVAGSAAACDLCAVYSAGTARGEIGTGPFAGVAEQFTYFGTVQVDGRKVNDPSGQYLDSAISQVYGGYNFQNGLSLQFTAPVIYRYYKRPDSQGGIEHGTEAGLGDVALLGTYTPYRKLGEKFTLNWNLLAGIKFPTGSTERLKEEFNEVEDPIGPPSGIHGHDLTLGSGSFDGIVGSGVYGRWHHAFAAATVQYSIRSTGDYDYRFANDLTWAGGPGYYFVLQDNYTAGLQAVVSGEYKGKDKFGSETADDTGMTAVYLGPQLDFTWGENVSVYLAADFPVSIQNTALQTVADYRLRAGFTWRF
jgi:hypothetical protein